MRISKWGNSLAVRLPASIVETLDLNAGDTVEIVIAGARSFKIEKDDARLKALKRLRRLRRTLPPGFRFDREEANAR